MSDKFEYGTGRRKTATARTRVYAGSGNITVNGRAFEDYFPQQDPADDHPSAPRAVQAG